MLPIKTAAINADKIPLNCFSLSGSEPATIRGRIKIGNLIRRSFNPSAKSDVQKSPIKCISQIPANKTATLFAENLLNFAETFPSSKNDPARKNCDRLVRNKDTGNPATKSISPVKYK